MNGKLSNDAKSNNEVVGYAFKADIKHYFQTVDHKALLRIMQKRINDEGVLWLVSIILSNYESDEAGKGMPLGNWTSQFFANIYLNELDQFIKHNLCAKHYLRYVDDFAILHKSKEVLQEYEKHIKEFLQTLKLELHPEKCRILPLSDGVCLLGFRIFYHHKLVHKRNLRKIRARLAQTIQDYVEERLDAQDVFKKLQGWEAYAMHGNTYKLREMLRQGITEQLSKICAH
jgi:hypothetical protein